MKVLGRPTGGDNLAGARRRPIARRIPAILVAFACVTLAPGAVDAQIETKSEYRVKAWYLANFSKFVEWPEKAFRSPDAPFVIGVVGGYFLGPSLFQAIAKQTARGRKIEVRWEMGKKTDEELRECQILFISGQDRKRLAQILGALQGASVLVVGEADGFLQAGGMINFVLENDKVRFEINSDAAARAGLKLSSQLLATARNILASPAAPKS